MEKLKLELRERYKNTYNECKKFNYSPSRFLGLITSDHDIIESTRKLIHKDGGTSGFATLFENKRMDLSVEAIILEPKFRVLFSRDDLQVAYNQLMLHEYDRLDELDMP